jgi:hypothetical protein
MMAVVALLSMRMTRTVDDQLVIIDPDLTAWAVSSAGDVTGYPPLRGARWSLP